MYLPYLATSRRQKSSEKRRLTAGDSFGGQIIIHISSRAKPNDEDWESTIYAGILISVVGFQLFISRWRKQCYSVHNEMTCLHLYYLAIVLLQCFEITCTFNIWRGYNHPLSPSGGCINLFCILSCMMETQHQFSVHKLCHNCITFVSDLY